MSSPSSSHTGPDHPGASSPDPPAGETTGDVGRLGVASPRGPAVEAAEASSPDSGSRYAPAPGNPVIRVAICDDHPVVRQGLRSFLTAQGFDVVGEAADGEEALRLVDEQHPDVLLTDLVMPGIDGIETIRRIRAASHGHDLGILVLTSFSGADQVIPAIRAGADGYLLKDAEAPTLAEAIRAVHRGEPLLAPEATAVVMAKLADDDAGADEGADAGAGHGSAATSDPLLDELTPREREVLAALGRGLTNRQLAEQLYISEKTVKTHVSSLLAKLRLPDRTQAALYAVRVGLADPRRTP